MNDLSNEGVNEAPFDFEQHRLRAVSAYSAARPVYERFAESISQVLRATLNAAEVRVHSIESRAKSIESFAIKAGREDEEDPQRPKYPTPLKDITDLAGVRVITFFPAVVGQVADLIDREFDIVEHVDHSQARLDEQRLGYESDHYIVRLKAARLELPEYNGYQDVVAEVQVRTVLQHAWAEIEHDIQYKSKESIPRGIARRFQEVAGALAMADREFQAIQDEHSRIEAVSNESVQRGDLDRVEITAEALRTYINKNFGHDGRISDYSFEVEARSLQRLGFRDLRQVEEAIGESKGRDLSIPVWGIRQGPLWRFRLALLAGMGENLIERAPFEARNLYRGALERLRAREVPIGNYAPPAP